MIIDTLTQLRFNNRKDIIWANSVSYDYQASYRFDLREYFQWMDYLEVSVLIRINPKETGRVDGGESNEVCDYYYDSGLKKFTNNGIYLEWVCDESPLDEEGYLNINGREELFQLGYKTVAHELKHLYEYCQTRNNTKLKNTDVSGSFRNRYNKWYAELKPLKRLYQSGNQYQDGHGYWHKIPPSKLGEKFFEILYRVLPSEYSAFASEVYGDLTGKISNEETQPISYDDFQKRLQQTAVGVYNTYTQYLWFILRNSGIDNNSLSELVADYSEKYGYGKNQKPSTVIIPNKFVESDQFVLSHSNDTGQSNHGIIIDPLYQSIYALCCQKRIDIFNYDTNDAATWFFNAIIKLHKLAAKAQTAAIRTVGLYWSEYMEQFKQNESVSNRNATKQPLYEELTKSEVLAMIDREIDNLEVTKRLEAKIRVIVTKCIEELLKTLWQKKSFWEPALRGNH